MSVLGFFQKIFGINSDPYGFEFPPKKVPDRPFTAQEIFDRVSVHLFRQGKQAYDINFGCMYRTPDGSMCAVGCLLPDSTCQDMWEGQTIDGIWGPETERLFGPHMDILTSLQRVHDAAIGDNKGQWKSTEAMRSELRKVGREYGLSTKILDGLKFKDR